MFAKALQFLFSPSIHLATKISRFVSPEPVIRVAHHRQVARFKTSSRRIRRVS